jgi:ankyrin repeat protein
MATTAGAVLTANRFVHFSENPIAIDILVVGGMIATYLSTKVKNEELLWDSIGKDAELVKICLEAGVDPNGTPEEVAPSFSGMNLFRAVDVGLDTESTKYLIQAGVDLQAREPGGNTALMFLCDRFIHPEDEERQLASLEIAAMLIEHGIVLTRKNVEGDTALHLAIKYGHLEIARRILQTGCSPDVRNLKGRPPLMSLSLVEQVLFEDQWLSLIDLLVEYNANLKAADNSSWTVLHQAVIAGTPNIIKKLLEHQADPNIKGLYDATPLMVASYYGNLKTAKILLQHGADIHRPSHVG